METRNKTKLVAERMGNYYGSVTFNPVTPSDLRFRHFRVKTAKGEWIKVKRKIKDKEELINNIKALKGADIYYGTSTWLNPDKLSTKEGRNSITEAILLKNDLVFDIDCDEPFCLETLEVARKITNNVYEAMKKYTKEPYEFEYCAWTGAKGFRLVYKDHAELNEADPQKRIALVTHNRKVFIAELTEYIEELKEKGKAHNVTTNIDETITTNPLCVIRVLNTAHSKTGFLTQKIPISLLKQNISIILSKIPCIYEKRPEIPSIREMTHGEEKKVAPRPQAISTGEDVSGLTSLPNNHFVSNKVVETRCLVPVLIYQSAKNYEREIKRLQDDYNLGDLYLLKHNKDIYVLSLKLFQKGQLTKMLNKTSSRTKNSMSKYGEIYIPLNAAFFKCLPGMLKGQGSKAHRTYLNTKYKLNLKPLMFETKHTALKVTTVKRGES